ncbi:MAG: hypothetical protein RBT78_07160 [Kiritimatiellia bacterium]|jgi:hypothetical protein|nr:hypothetical protein [Kiritimatiellia bacterium]
MADTQNGKEDTRQWFLRINGETVFGPVSTEGLVVWAEQGRILPGHEISADRKKWVQAVSEPLLDMRWFVDDGTGELRGPLNRCAAEALLKSGKVPEGAMLVAADEVDADASAEASAGRSPRPPRSAAPDAGLLARNRELEASVAELRERLAQLAESDALETLRRECGTLAGQVREVTEQRDTLLRNAEKDARANERKIEGLKQQIRKLEQRCEETDGRLLLSDAAAGQAQALRRAEAETRAKCEAAEKELVTVREELAALTVTCERLRGANAEREALRSRLAEAEVRAAEAQTEAERNRDGAGRLRAAEAEREALRSRLAEAEARATEARERLTAREEERNALQAALCEQEAAFAELLTDANSRDNAYQEQIASLTKACAQPPEETARFYEDQAALFELMTGEADALAEGMEAERTHLERLKEWSAQRQQFLSDRRQALLQRLGVTPADMTRRALREHPSDPNANRLRTEFDNVKVAHEREARLAAERERDLQRKVRVMEAEAGKWQERAAAGDKLGRRLQEMEEVLRRREQELADERKSREAEREQYQSSQQALLMRIEALEKASRPVTPDDVQAAEARNVKLASWMRLKR